MQLDFVARHGLRILVFAAVIMVVLGCSNNTTPTLLPTSSASTGLYCTASATALSASTGTYISVSNVSVSISGGAGPFAITLPGASTVTSSAPTYTYSGSLNVTTDSTGNVTSYVGVTDQSTGGSTSCALSLTNTTGTSGGTYTSGGYYTGGYVTCSLQFTPGYYHVGQQIPFWIQTSDGESAYLTALNTGEPYATQPVFPIWAPFYIQYSYVGAKQISLYASTASGIPCNGGAVISDSIFINY